MAYKARFNRLTKQTSLCPQCLKEREDEENAKKQRQALKDVERAIEESEIPLRFKNKTLNNFTADTPEKSVVLAVAKGFASNFKHTLATGRNLMLYGTTGTGKTHLACGIAIEAIKQGFKAKFTEKTYDILLQAQGKHTGKIPWTTEAQIVRDLDCALDLLIIDEVGIQYGTDSERIIMSNLINKRYRSMRPTILLSNLNLNEISEYLGQRVIDRMNEDEGTSSRWNGNPTEIAIKLTRKTQEQEHENSQADTNTAAARHRRYKQAAKRWRRDMGSSCVICNNSQADEITLHYTSDGWDTPCFGCACVVTTSGN